MGKTDRGHFTVSTNVILTMSVITRTLTFGLLMLIVYIKEKGTIFDDNVTKIMDLETSYGIPMGSAMRSIAYSMIGIFLMEFMTGIFGTLGGLCRVKVFLVTSVLLSSMMLLVYIVYMVLLALLYDKTNCLYATLTPYINAYWDSYSHGYDRYMSSNYYYNVFPGFVYKLGCGTSHSELHSCSNVCKEQIRTYLKTYFGVFITCILCQIISIVASEYTYRKFEFKKMQTGLKKNSYFLLLTLRYGILRAFFLFVRRGWRTSKIIFFSSVLKFASMVANLGLFGFGLVLTGDVMISNGSLKHIFYQIQFYQYYFYDILVGLSASAVVIGFLGTASSVFCMVGSWRRSPMLQIMGCISSVVMLLPKLVVLVFWFILIIKINNNMKYQLRNQQNGYYSQNSNSQNTLTTEWNSMILALDCCGVYNTSDTIDYYYGAAFCCNIAHEFRMDPSGHYRLSYRPILYYGGCGGYKTRTCNSMILHRTNMYGVCFLSIVVLLIILELIGIILMNKEYHVMHFESLSDGTKHGRSKVLKSFLVIFKSIWTGVKLFLAKHCIRSKPDSFYLVSLAVVLLCGISLLSNAVRIRYDEVFGNKDIRPLLNRINITDTTFIDAIDDFSTVITTFSIASLAAVAYSASIMVPKKFHKFFRIAGMGMWICLVITHIIEIGIWSKFHTEMSSKVTEQLENDITQYRYSHRSGLSYYDQLSFYWNTLFVKARCCGTNSTSNLTFHETYWYRYHRDDNNQELPVQCCTSQTDVYPYDFIYDNTCRYTTHSFHEVDCPTVIATRLSNHYTIPFFVLTCLLCIAETIIFITTFMLMQTQTLQDKNIELVGSKKIGNKKTINASEQIKVEISKTKEKERIRSKPIQRESSRKSILSRSWKVEPEQSVLDGKNKSSRVLTGSGTKREKSQVRNLKKETERESTENKTDTTSRSTKEYENGNINKHKVISKQFKNENEESIKTELKGDSDFVTEEQSKGNIEIDDDNEDKLGHLTEAWQMPDENPDTSIISNIPESSIRSAMSSIRSANNVQPANEMDVVDM